MTMADSGVTAQHSGRDGGARLAVVLTGSIGRGAFQAGALGHLLTQLEESGSGLRPAILIGTSAGSINAAMWANRAGLPAREAAEEITGVWERMNSADAYRRIASPSTIVRDVVPGLEGLLGHGGGITSLLDTAPLADTLGRLIPGVDFTALPDGVPPNRLEAVGVVATWVPPAATTGSPGGRSVLFLQERSPSGWAGDATRAIDVDRSPVTARHVLASCALPVGFPAVHLGAEHVSDRRRIGWYVDGGVRLNCALGAAVRLGATHIVLISAMSLHYPDYPDAPQPSAPRVDDGASQVLHALLADRTVEDLLAIERVNRLIDVGGANLLSQQDPEHRSFRVVNVMPVAPAPGRLGHLAQQAWTARYAGALQAAGLEDNAWLGRVLRVGGDGPGRRDLLSYLLFDETYFTDSIQHGIERATSTWKRGWLTTTIAQSLS
jgi:NTE family protein